ncbi:MAG: TadE/TadG family type IV pilus assembly protein [Candidatus Korobacteraceae bacterium]
MKSRIASLRRGEAGSSLLEFAFAASIFFLLLISIFDFSYLYLYKMELQNAVRQAGRYAITGQAMSSMNRYSSILQTVSNLSSGLANSDNTTVCSSTGGCGNAGGPGDVVTVTVNYNYEFHTPLISKFFTNGKYTIKVSSSFKNEAFPPDQS